MKYPKTINLPLDEIGEFFTKIKLHGTNAHISVKPGQIRVGSRNTEYFNCANGTHFDLEPLVLRHRDYFERLASNIGNYVILGEWCGKGIQKKVACSQLTEKHFFIFGIIFNSQYTFCPDILALLLKDLPFQFKIIPRYKVYQLPEDRDLLESDIQSIDQEDPYILEEFGIRGVGEGLVLHKELTVNITDIEEKIFKVKGTSHKILAKNTESALKWTNQVYLFKNCDELEYEKALERENIKRGDLTKIPQFLKSLIADQVFELEGDWSLTELKASKKVLSSKAVSWFKGS